MKKKKNKKVKDLSKTKKVTAPIQSRKPNDFGRSGNNADRELEMLRGMDKKKASINKKK